jgi:hypothetical protein
MSHEGSCLCGAVKLEVARIELQPEACHCTMCRKHTGHFLVGVNVKRKDLTIRGEDKVGWYRSSQEVRRGFCTVCGSTLFWDALKEGYDYISIAMGLFDKPTGLRLRGHIFVADKGDYYDIDDDLPKKEAW